MNSILVCDDHPLIVQGLVALLAGDRGWNVVATSRDGREALNEIEARRPDIALLDIAMPVKDGIQVLKTVNQEKWPVRVVLLTASITDDQLLEAVAAGAAGIVLKESASETLLHCLRQVSQGRSWLPQELIRPALSRRASAAREVSPFARLTKREHEIAQGIAQGQSNREIALALGLSEGTVKIHLHSIYAKLDVNNRTALAILFARQQNGLPS
jgi:DNA-binding NarL/FixJ family response regulator